MRKLLITLVVVTALTADAVVDTLGSNGNLTVADGATVTLDANGGSVSGQSSVTLSVESGRSTGQAGASRTVTRSGYTLVGWYDTKFASGGNMVFDARGYAVDGKYWDGSYEPGSSSASWRNVGGATAYARWASHSYTVTLDANGGSVSGQPSVTLSVESGRSTGQAGASRTVVRSGYTLVGWYDTKAATGGNMVFDARGYAVDGKYWDGAYEPGLSAASWRNVGGMIAYARWAYDTYMVTLDANKGSVLSQPSVTAPRELVGTFADGDGMFLLTLDGHVAYLLIWTEEDCAKYECEAIEFDSTIVLMTEVGEVYNLVWDSGRLVATPVE